MIDNPDRETILASLAEEFIRIYRDGKSIDVETLVMKHPTLADEIRDLYSTIIEIEKIKKDFPQSKLSIADETRKFPTIRNYQINRIIGRGGMGIVYEAVQKSLERRVALKILGRSYSMSPARVARFAREAEAAAQLHHKNIVPVFEVGNDNGLYYYAMQFIDGVGLDEIIDSLSNHQDQSKDQTETAKNDITKTITQQLFSKPLRDSAIQNYSGLRKSQSRVDKAQDEPQEITVVRDRRYWHNIALIVSDIADAIEYAHRHQILHRDIKPANILLDDQGKAWIADFGLAKHLEDDGLTRTGDVVGTLRYMAPEQLDGDTTAASDTYSLGLVLYELLTLVPAFTEPAHSLLIRQKQSGQFRAPRKIDRRIPRDLETITMKACATNPGHRYLSASELAGDLRRFIDNRSISARKTSTTEQTWQWCTRNPGLAIASSIAVLLLIAAVSALIIGNLNTRSALNRALVAQHREKQTSKEAQNALKRAENNLNLAAEAFDTVFDNITNRGLPKPLSVDLEGEEINILETDITEADAELLTGLLTFYEQFAENNYGNPNLLVRKAEAHRRIGEIQKRLGQIELAQSSHQKSIAIYTELLTESPRNLDWIVGKARALNEVAILMSITSEDANQVLTFHRANIDWLKKQEQSLPQKPEVRFQLGIAYDTIGSIAVQREIVISSVETGRGKHPPKPIKQRNDPSTKPKRKPDRGDSYWKLADRFFGNRHKDSENDLLAGNKIFHELVEQFPNYQSYRLALAQSERNLFVHYLMRDKYNDATRAFLSTRREFEKLVKDNPLDPDYKKELAFTLSIATIRIEWLKPEDAKEYTQQAIKIAKQLVTMFPRQSNYEALLAISHRNLARIFERERQMESAVAEARIAKSIFESLNNRFPDHDIYALSLGSCANELAEFLRLYGDAESNQTHYEEALEIATKAIDEFPSKTLDAKNSKSRKRILSKLYGTLSRIHRELGEHELANLAKKRAKELDDRPIHEIFDFRPFKKPR